MRPDAKTFYVVGGFFFYMSKKDEIKRLWAESFGDSREFVEMYFDRVYRDADAMTLMTDDGHVASALLLQPYGLSFHGLRASASYVAGAATKRNMRGKGLMTALMADTLMESRRRGDIITILIPASSYLYGFYARMGFATVAFTDIMRYTALHSFAHPEDSPFEEFTPVDDIFDRRVYDAMARMEHRIDRTVVLHSHRDFLNILDDITLDGGTCVAISDSERQIAAIAWGRPATDGSDTIRVDQMLYSSPTARLAALRQLRMRWPGRPFAVMAPVDDNGRHATPRGMARIVDAAKTLALIASTNPDIDLLVRVTDQLIESNNATYHLQRGECREALADNIKGRTLDFDIDITTLCELVFSSPSIGNITGLPAQRLDIALMLD